VRIKLVTNILNDLMGLQSDVDLPDIGEITFQSLLDHLVKRYGERVRHRIFVKEEIAPYVTVMINGKPISLTDAAHHPLQDGDQVNLITAIVAGG
jgi:sulfur carrier protein ThiS